jgi:hypothetical protein
MCFLYLRVQIFSVPKSSDWFCKESDLILFFYFLGSFLECKFIQIIIYIFLHTVYFRLSKYITVVAEVITPCYYLYFFLYISLLLYGILQT